MFLQRRVAKFQWEDKKDDELHMSDFKAYLAGSSDEDEDEAAEAEGDKKKGRKEEERARLRRLLLGETADDKKKSKKSKKDKKTKKDKKAKKAKKEKKEKKGKAVEAGSGSESESEVEDIFGGQLDEGDDDGEDGNKESTFVPGLGEAILKRKAQRELEAAETPFEKAQRLAKEKRKAKRAAAAAAAEGDGDSGSDNGSGGGSDSEPGATKPLSRKEKQERKAKKLLRAKKRRLEATDADAFEVDLADNRFAGLVSDPKFAVDVQDKNFKNSKVCLAVMMHAMMHACFSLPCAHNDSV